MNKTKYIALGLLLIGQLTVQSCNNWLDVKPEDKTLEEDIFANEGNVQKALNGIYDKLASNALYGQQLTKSTVDVLAQYYNSSAKTISGINIYKEVVDYNYSAIESQDYFSQIWNNAYSAILSMNNFLDGLDKYNSQIPVERLNILKGEVYAMRAMMHFDLLRLFGPIYSQNKNAQAIPYKKDTDVALSKILNANEVVQFVLQDLQTAEQLLNNDPIKTFGNNNTNSNWSAFYQHRNRRMNYYAVIALKSRVALYAEDYQLAKESAQDVIDAASQWFPWQGEQDHLGLNGNRVFSSEVIFGLEDIYQYNSFNQLFNSALNNDKLLAPSNTGSMALNIYGNNAQDFRYIANWEDLSSSQVTRPYSKLFIKYQDIDNKAAAWRNFQPMLRMSEMYYILAEIDQDIAPLNTVRSHRGLEPLGNLAVLNTELRNEYRKEFLGEGQLFYFYKRTNQASIVNHTGGSIDMNASKYVVPLPLSETNQR